MLSFVRSLGKRNQVDEFVRMEENSDLSNTRVDGCHGVIIFLRINGAGSSAFDSDKNYPEMGYFGMNDEPFACNYGED